MQDKKQNENINLLDLFFYLLSKWKWFMLVAIPNKPATSTIAEVRKNFGNVLSCKALQSCQIPYPKIMIAR